MISRVRLAVLGTMTLLTMSTTAHRADAAADPKVVAKCQAALAKGGTKFVGKKLATFAKCTDGIFKCIQTVDETPDAGAKRTACVAKARAKCGGAFAAIGAARQALAAAVSKACAGLDAAQLTGADGLEYSLAGCNAFGGTVTDLASLTTCLVREHDCLATAIFQLEVPRASELLKFTPPDAVTVGDGDALACLVDVGGTGTDVNDVALGKSVAKCQQAVGKIGAKLASQRLGALAKCTDALFVCAETKAGDALAACNAKARAGCVKSFAKNHDQSDAAKAAAGKACGDAAVFTAFLMPAGGNLDALLPSALSIGPRAASPLAGLCPALATIGEYETCLATQLLDYADDLQSFETPRTVDLLSGVGCTVGACGAEPTPTPTATPGADGPGIKQIIDENGDDSGNTFLEHPTAVTTDLFGNVFVAGGDSENVFKITGVGAITEIMSFQDNNGHSLDNPQGLATDSSGNVYVSGFASNNVFKIAPNGTITQILDSTGDGTHAFAGGGALAVGPGDVLYANGGNSRNVFKITTTGTTTITQILGLNAGPSVYPIGIAVDANSNVYVSRYDDTVSKITAGGGVSTLATGQVDATHFLQSPRGIGVFGSFVYAAAGLSDVTYVFKIANDGGSITPIIDHTGDGLGHPFDEAAGLAIDALGNVYVTDYLNHQVFQIKPTGAITRIFDSTGDGVHGASLFQNPQSIAVDGHGRIFIAALGSNNVFRVILP